MSKPSLLKRAFAVCAVAFLSLMTWVLWVYEEEIGGVATVVFVSAVNIFVLLGIGLSRWMLKTKNTVWSGNVEALIAEMESWEQEGSEAYHVGLSIEDNPYQQDQLAAMGWSVGWEAAKDRTKELV